MRSQAAWGIHAIPQVYASANDQKAHHEVVLEAEIALFLIGDLLFLCAGDRAREGEVTTHPKGTAHACGPSRAQICKPPDPLPLMFMSMSLATADCSGSKTRSAPCSGP